MAETTHLMHSKMESDGESMDSTSSFNQNPTRRKDRNNIWANTRRFGNWTSHLAVALCVSVLWGTIFLYTGRMQEYQALLPLRGRMNSSGNITSTRELFTCGHNSDEARKLGCKYDILSNNWLPANCIDYDAIEDYKEDGSWYPFRDRGRKDELKVDQLGDLEVYYTSARDHIVHCAALWRKQYLAFFDQREHLDSIITNREHTMHCTHYLVNMTSWGTDFWDMPIPVYPGYAGCWMRT